MLLSGYDSQFSDSSKGYPIYHLQSHPVANLQSVNARQSDNLQLFDISRQAWLNKPSENSINGYCAISSLSSLTV